MTKLSHTDDKGKANMVDVGHKPDMARMAVASGFIRLQENTLALIQDNSMKKGDVLAVARIAGIQAAKQTSNLIPLCHPLPLHKIDVEALLKDNGIQITATVACNGKTGVEMEAITATGIALITIYDMCKAVDKTMVIEKIELLKKEKS